MAEQPTGGFGQAIEGGGPAAAPGALSRWLLLPLWEKGRNSLILAVRSLWLQKMRAFLSVLGIIIGTSAVIALMAFGEGSMQDALEDIKRQGTTNVIVQSVKPPEESATASKNFFIVYGLTYEDYDRLKGLPTVIGSVPMRVLPQDVTRQGRMVRVRVVATTEDYRKVNRFRMEAGRFLDDSDHLQGEGDDRNMRNVCVLGANVARTLFPFESPMGQTIVLRKQNYVVVGVIADRMPVGANAAGKESEEFNNDVYISLRAALGRIGSKMFLRSSGSMSGEVVELHQITLTVSDMDEVRPTGKVVRDILARHHKENKDWSVTVPLDRLELAEAARDRYKLLLLLIASISLVVGGIGIMNIMLATVTERTREIGIRRALGAKRRDITLQFVIEAVVQTTVGGFFGVLFGLVIVYGVPFVAMQFFGKDLPTKLHVPSIFYALVVSVGVGVLFGWYPARRAAYLDPIEALRHM